MKHQSILFFAILFSMSIVSTSFAQDIDTDQEILLDVEIGYGNKIEAFGIKGGAVYRINEQFRAAADGIYFFSGEDSEGLEFNWLEINTNGHYLIEDQETMKFYVLTGLNFTKLFSDDNITLSSGDSTDKLYVGLNIGAGAEFSLGSVIGVIEGKYALSSAHQLVMSAGLRIPL